MALNVERLVARLVTLPGVVAVALGGSRARGEHRPDSDWDFGLYFHGPIDAGAVRALGYAGDVVEPGRWGRIVNGGAWLTVDGEPVDLLYRDLEFVLHWLAEAEAGRFEVDLVAGHIVGLPTYVLAGELALNRVLTGELPKPAFPQPLRQTAPRWWHGNAAFSLYGARQAAARGEVSRCAGLLARAALAEAQARLAERGEWALNEKGLLGRAGLAGVDRLLAAPGADAAALNGRVAAVERLLGIDDEQPPGVRPAR